jgi:Zn-dependent protease
MEGPPPLRQNDPSLHRVERETGSIPREKAQATGVVGTLAAIGLLIAKFFAPLVKLLPFLKTGATMLMSIGAYALFYGWRWAVGFVLLIFVHECGHMVAARRFGLHAGLPVFVPFVGAYVALKNAPRDAWIEAWVGIGGPILGAIGALLCHAAAEQFHSHLLMVLAQTGYLLNLFNLIPFLPLDGGRVIVAFSPRNWLAGLAVVGWLAWVSRNPIVFLLLFGGAYCAYLSFRLRTDEEHRYLEVTSTQRRAIWLAYFGLIAALVYGMYVTGLKVGTRGTPFGF